MVTTIYSAARSGCEAVVITIEVSLVNGTQLFMVGLADSSIRESQHRIESSLKHMAKSMPRKRLIINLAPADLRKEGSAYDLPIALAILQVSKQVYLKGLEEYLILGELALDGGLRPVTGVIAIALKAREAGFKGVILPKENAVQAALIPDIEVIAATHMEEVIHFLTSYHLHQGAARKRICYLDEGEALDKKDSLHKRPVAKTQCHTIPGSSTSLDQSCSPQKTHPPDIDPAAQDKVGCAADYSDVQGQLIAKRAFEIAAAGGHHLLLVGPPGAGKTMLAERLPTILPPLTMQQMVETTLIHSLRPEYRHLQTLKTQPPFRAVHHTITPVALVGGGRFVQPGELSLAHNGVLFLDEFTEFKRATLEVMRQPLEAGQVTICRASSAATFPCRCILIISFNPCPCGYYTDPRRRCICTPYRRARYMEKLSGPLLDRIDLYVHLEALPPEAFRHRADPESQHKDRRARRPRNRASAQQTQDQTPHHLNKSLLQHKRKKRAERHTYYSSSAMKERIIAARAAQKKRFQSHPNITTNSMIPPQLISRWCLPLEAANKAIENNKGYATLSARGYDRICRVARTIADLDHKSVVTEKHLLEALFYRNEDLLRTSLTSPP